MKEKEEILKLRRLYNLMYVLFHMKIVGQKLKCYFENHNYQKVAVYGMGNLGRIILEEFAEEGIDVKYVIDRNAEIILWDIDIYRPDDKLEEVDVIVVTTITHFDEIKRELSKSVCSAIVSIEDIIKEVI